MPKPKVKSKSMKHSSLKNRGESKKNQGSHTSSAAGSDTPDSRNPRSHGRGIGSSFAYALSKLLGNVDSISGSKNGFLGVEKKDLSVKEYAKTLSDKKKGK